MLVDAMSSTVIEYRRARSAPHVQWRLIHTWMLPLAALPGAAGSLYWYGDDYGGLAGANIPAVLLIQLLPETLRAPFLRAGYAPIAGLTLILLVCVGVLMDWLRVRRWIYLLAPPIFLAMVLSKVFAPGNVPRLASMTYREWDPDSLCVAWSWSVYALAACVLPPVLLVRVFVRLRRFIGRRSEVV
jgi:hypothetical protein